MVLSKKMIEDALDDGCHPGYGLLCGGHNHEIPDEVAAVLRDRQRERHKKYLQREHAAENDRVRSILAEYDVE